MRSKACQPHTIGRMLATRMALVGGHRCAQHRCHATHCSGRFVTACARKATPGFSPGSCSKRRTLCVVVVRLIWKVSRRDGADG